MPVSAIFPEAPMRAGMYESFYLRAVAPDEPVGVWIRHTVLKHPGQSPRGSVWCTVFDARRPQPFMHKLTTDELEVPSGGWIAVGDASETPRREDLGREDPRDEDARGQGASMTPGWARGTCGAARWSLRFGSDEPELHHLPRRWLYRTPLPRTKLTSPAPAARFDGTLEVAGQSAIGMRGWRGMIGHNWGSEHAERWIWLHGVGFEEAPEAWLDVALGRLKMAGRMTPWVANGALSLDGRRYRVGGLTRRGLRVSETAAGCVLRLPGERGLTVEARIEVPAGAAAGWRYADPGEESKIGATADPAPSAVCPPVHRTVRPGGHDVVNCSVASLALRVKLPGGAAPRSLHTSHGGAYELGMRERSHGVPVAPFPDG
jgi:hypothetical protein